MFYVVHVALTSLKNTKAFKKNQSLRVLINLDESTGQNEDERFPRKSQVTGIWCPYPLSCHVDGTRMKT